MRQEEGQEFGQITKVSCNGAAYLITEPCMRNPDCWRLLTEGGISMKRLLLVALGIALLLVLASALPAAAYGGESSATLSCTDNPSTITKTVIVTIAWHAAKEGVNEADAQAGGGRSPVHLR